MLPLSLAQERCFSAYRAVAVGSIVNFAEGPENLVAGLREIAPHVVMATPSFFEMLETTVDAALSDASPLGRLAWRLAIDPSSAQPKARSLGSSHRAGFGARPGPDHGRMAAYAHAVVRRCAQCLPPALSRWYRELGLNVEALCEDSLPPGANDILVQKESR